MADEVIEQILCIIKECHVYKIPPRASATGYKAEDWEGNLIWTGRCKVMARGENCEIRLEDPKTGDAFAVCPVNTNPNAPPAVERVIDSSRYFVLRIEDGRGNYAYIGMGFKERSEAFDFNVALQDFQKCVLLCGDTVVLWMCRALYCVGADRRMACVCANVACGVCGRQSQAPAPLLNTEPSTDYSLKQGQSIHIDLKGVGFAIFLSCRRVSVRRVCGTRVR